MSLLPANLPVFVPDDRYTVEQYLAVERATGKRYEFHDGILVSVESMAGGSYNHSVMAGNFIGEARSAIIAAEATDARLEGCHVSTSGLRIAVEGGGARYLYADAIVVCGGPAYDEVIPTAIINPTVVVEVVSPSSEGYDRGRKFDFYGALASLREYLIVEQDTRRIEVRHRPGAAAAWQYTVVTAAEDAVALPSLGLTLPMRGLYRGWQAPAA